MRLFFQFEDKVARILNNHWEEFDIIIFDYLQTFKKENKDEDTVKFLNNYSGVCLKILANIY